MKTERKKLDEKILKVWADCVKHRDRKCQIPGCHSDYKLSAHHIAPRQYRATRHDLLNGLCLCAGHHMIQKVDPEKFRALIISAIGQTLYDQMHELAWGNGRPHKLTLKDMQDHLGYLQRQLKSLQNAYGEIV